MLVNKSNKHSNFKSSPRAGSKREKNKKHEQDNLTISLIYEIYSKTCTSI